MNLRQQFFWKVLLVISSVAIFYSLVMTYNKYDSVQKEINIYKNEVDDKGKQSIKAKANFILTKQQNRNSVEPNYGLISEKAVMDHVRAGLKTASGNDWGSKDPVYKAHIGSICVIEYRDEEKTRYMVGDKIDGTNMVIQSCNQDSIKVNIDSRKGTQVRVFYMSKTINE